MVPWTASEDAIVSMRSRQSPTTPPLVPKGGDFSLSIFEAPRFLSVSESYFPSIFA